MFQSVDEVVKRWQERFEKDSYPENLLPHQGYDVHEIEKFEHDFKRNLPITFKHILLKINLDTVSFRNLTFGGGFNYIQTLYFLNKPLVSNFVVVSSPGIYTLKMDGDGVIYAELTDHNLTEAIAPNFEFLICFAAEIADKQWGRFASRTEALKVATDYLANRSITFGRSFWADLIRNAVKL